LVCSPWWVSTPAGPLTREATMFDLVLGGVVAAAIAVYLVYALLYPEKL
jgi:K+-transporting ATPase KdpF subunit